MNRSMARVAVTALFAAVLPMLPAVAGTANAGTTLGYTLEGCRNDGPPDPAPYPAAGPYICADAAYTTGNLGKGWAELDLVPHRISLTANTAETDTLTLAGDQQRDATDNAIIGWDYISVPVLNDPLSPDSCDATVSDGGFTNDGAAVGGTFKTARRVFTVDVPQTSAQHPCVYDYYQRLSLGSGGFPGSSLQSYILDSQGGKKTISIPVPVLKQVATKDMTATQNSDYAWDIVKTSNPTSLNLGNTCTSSSGSSATVAVTVTWTRYAAVQGGPITLIAHVYASNPASRDLSVSITDRNYAGSNPDPTTDPVLSTTPALNPVSTTVAGRTFAPVLVATFGPVTVADGSLTTITDIATVQYTDPVIHDIVGTLKPQATATVSSSGTATNATASVTDSESISGTGLTFSVSTPSLGGFTGTPAYIAGAHTTGPVEWSSGATPLTGSGSVTFNKTVYADHGTSTSSGALTDTAILTTSGGVHYTSNALSIPITSTTLGTITVTKTAPAEFQGTDTASFVIHLATGTTYAVANDVATHTFVFNSSTPVVSGVATLSYTFTGLAAGDYVLHEDPVSTWTPQDDQPVSLSGATVCGDSKTFNNGHQPAIARAVKVTVPAGNEAGWDFTLTRNGTTYATGTTNATGNVVFNPNPPGSSSVSLDEGSYVFTETAKTGWDQTGSTGCTFTVNYPADNDRTFTCTITNTQRGHVTVLKTENGGVPDHVYTFTLGGGPDGVSLSRSTTPGQVGSLDFGLLKPGSYTLCELAVPAGTHSTLEDQGGTPNGAGDVCVTFTLAAGETRAFTVDNTHPNGDQRTIGYWKHWNSYTLGLPANTCTSSRTGNTLMDCLLPQPLGNYVVDTAAKGVAVLSSPSSKYAENQLAAQLLAAELNRAAGASICTSVTNAITQANAMLAEIGYAGPGSTIVGSNWHDSTYTRSDFVNTASLLNNYNNGLVC